MFQRNVTTVNHLYLLYHWFVYLLTRWIDFLRLLANTRLFVDFYLCFRSRRMTGQISFLPSICINLFGEIVSIEISFTLVIYSNVYGLHQGCGWKIVISIQFGKGVMGNHTFLRQNLRTTSGKSGVGLGGHLESRSIF